MSRHFDNWLKAYLQYAAFTEAPESYHFWTGVSTIAGALRAKVYLDMGNFQWTPNFYIILVGKAGRVNKSTSINYGMKLLKRLQGIKFGANSLTWQFLVEDLRNAAEAWPVGEDGSFITYSCVTYAASELGTLIDPKDTNMMDVLTDLWDNNTDWKRGTRGEGMKVIENPWVNIIAGTTPEWIADRMPVNLIGAGFTSRCLFVYETEKRQLIPYPRRAAQKANVRVWDMAPELIQDLEHISQLQGEFTLTEEAYELGEAWYLEHYNAPPVQLNERDFGGYISRKQGHTHKLAMVLSAAKRDSLVITAEDLNEAIQLVSSLETTMPLVLGGMHEAQETRAADKIAEVLMRHGSVHETTLFRRFNREITYKQFKDVRDNLVAADLVALEVKAEGLFLRWKG